MSRILIAAGLATLIAGQSLAQAPAPAPAPAPSATADKTGEADAEKPQIASLIVFGNDPCPRSTDGEIVVCARLPEGERYRIPKRFRGKRSADAPAPDTWANRVSTLESVSRQGLPNSCSVVGSGGQTGCMQQFLHQAWQERHQAKVQTDADDAP